jgi:hypothetical protein
MANRQRQGEPEQPKAELETALVLFGELRVLPAELEELGLAGKVETREIPGVPPNWKPANAGDFLLGRCVDRREQRFDMGKPDERVATVLVFDTAIPGGFRSVWLGADLKLKLHDPVGKVYQIFFEGTSTPTEKSRRLNPMKTYRVMEILPKEPPQITDGE